MAPRGAPGRLRVTPRSAVLAVGLLGLTLVLLRVVVAAQRVIGWIMVAAAIAGLLHPPVQRLSRRLPHGLAVLVVVGATMATAGIVAFKLVDAVVTETTRLQRAGPEAARRIERDGRFAEVASDARLAERTERFLEELPERLRGGTPAQALRAAATRGVAYLATAVLSIFFLLHGSALAAGAARQFRDAARREQLQRVVLASFHRGFGYARGSIAMSAGAGLLAYGLARAAEVPGPVPLGLWVALWDLVPIIGLAVGALPIVVLGGVGNTGRGVALAAAVLAYQVIETLVLQRRLERRTIRLGPFLTTAGGLAGLELYGIGGALVSVLVLALAVAALDELAPAEPAVTTTESPGGTVGLMPLFSFEGKVPNVHPDAFVAATATIVGDVVIEAGASIWYGAVVRGDCAQVIVRTGANVQDGAVLHGSPGMVTEVGAGATVGHLCLVHGAVLGEGCMVANGSTVLDGATIGAGAMVAAHSLVPANTVIPDGFLAAGVPADIRRPVEGSPGAEWVRTNSAHYAELAQRHMRSADPVT